MTNPNAVGAPTLTENQRALAAAIGEGFAEALQPLTMLLRGELLATRTACEELVAAVDRLTQVIGAQAAGDIDPDDAPEIEMPLERFHSFDWSTISAQVLAEDEFGPAIVAYGGKAFKRRSPDNQYDPAIWFSRAIGKTPDGRNQYVRLITFKPMSDKVEPMGRKAERALNTAAPATAAPPPQQTRPASTPTQQPSTTQQPAPAAVPPAASAPAPCTGPAQPTLPEEPDWPDRTLSVLPPQGAEATAEEEFNSWPSASGSKPPLQAKQPPAGPRVSGGAARDDQSPTPAAKPAATPPANRRQATIGGGEVYATFTRWGNDFARRYPHYRIAKSERTDFYHLQVSLYSLGETEDHKDSRYAFIKELDLLNEAIAAMEKHAAAHHA